jgi:hypothetical protein
VKKNLFRKTIQFLKQNWRDICSIGLAAFVAFVAFEQLSISRYQKDISKQQFEFGKEQGLLVKQQAIIAEKQLLLSSSLAHTHVDPNIFCEISFPKEGQFSLVLFNNSPIKAAGLVVGYHGIGINALNKIKIINGFPADVIVPFYSGELAPLQRIKLGLHESRRLWTVHADQSRPEGSRITRYFYIVRMEYFRETDMKKYVKTQTYEVTDAIKGIISEVKDLSKHPGYLSIMKQLEELKKNETFENQFLMESMPFDRQ